MAMLRDMESIQEEGQDLEIYRQKFFLPMLFAYQLGMPPASSNNDICQKAEYAASLCKRQLRAEDRAMGIDPQYLP